jgi:hypothetical protein
MQSLDSPEHDFQLTTHPRIIDVSAAVSGDVELRRVENETSHITPLAFPGKSP